MGNPDSCWGVFIKLHVEGARKYHFGYKAPCRDESYELKVDRQVIIDLHTLFVYSLGCKQGKSRHNVLFNLQLVARGKICNYRLLVLLFWRRL